MPDAIRVAICEDTIEDAEYLRRMIIKLNPKAEITLFAQGEDFLDAVSRLRERVHNPKQPPFPFSIVFMDVYMEPGLTGIETARKFREMGVDCRLVFTTTSADHSLEAFDVDAEQYLIKPVEYSRLAKLFDKEKQPKQRIAESIHMFTKEKAINVPTADIMYIEVQNHTCYVHMTEATISASSAMKIDHFANLLPPPQFMHCHRSFIVNFNYVESVDRDCHMKNGDIVYIRRGDVSACARAFKEWILDVADEEMS